MMLRPRAVSLFFRFSKGSARAREPRSRKTRETRACLAFCSTDYRKKERLLVVYMVLIRWEIQKLWLENQIVRALFVELQKNMVCDLRG